MDDNINKINTLEIKKIVKKEKDINNSNLCLSITEVKK